MAYTEITNRTSPNYWAGGNSVQGITIHWWGDPAQNPTAEGIVNWLCNPASQVSAHFVATGTGRRVWQLVNDRDRAWHAMSGNQSTIGIECDPRCRDEDYDVVAELIADLWKFYGKLPIYPHSHWVSTRCPGNYDLGRLQRLAEAKLNGTAAPVQGDTEVKIGREANWRARMNKLHHQLVRNADMSDAVFNSIVGKDAWNTVENWSDHPEAQRLIDLQRLGEQAEKELPQLRSQLQKSNEALAAERGEKDKLVKQNQALIDRYSKQDADYTKANETGNSFLLWLGDVLNKFKKG